MKPVLRSDGPALPRPGGFAGGMQCRRLLGCGCFGLLVVANAKIADGPHALA